MTTSNKLREEDLPRLAGAAVQRALTARQSLTEMSTEETDLVGGALSFMGPLLVQPALTLRPGIWAGPLLAPLGQQMQTPVLNQRQF